MSFNRGYWMRLYVGGLVLLLLFAMIYHLVLGYGFVDPRGPGPFHGPASLLDGVARGDFGVWNAIQLVLITRYAPYVVGWTIALGAAAICVKVLGWISTPKLRD